MRSAYAAAAHGAILKAVICDAAEVSARGSLIFKAICDGPKCISRVPVASYALRFRRLVRAEARASAKVNLLAAAGVLSHSCVLTSSH